MSAVDAFGQAPQIPEDAAPEKCHLADTTQSRLHDSQAIHLDEKRAICGSAVFLTDIFQLEWRLGFVPYFRVSVLQLCIDF